MRAYLRLWTHRTLAHLAVTGIVLGTLLALFSLQPARDVSADTPVCGAITTNTTWIAANSPYIVTCDVTVANGVTLTIEPNVSVNFDPGTSLLVNGALIADACTFTSHEPTPARGDWGHILFTASSEDATFDANGDYVAGSKIKNCLVEWGGGGEGVNGAIEVDGASPFIHLNTIRQNGDSGIHATGRSAAVPVILQENNVNNNSGSTAGGGVYLATGRVISNTIANNSIVNHNGAGIHASDSTLIGNMIVDNHATDQLGNVKGGGVFATGSTLINNTINSNSTSARNGANGGGIYAIGCTLTGNMVNGNTAYRSVGEASGGGIYADGGTVTGNIVHGNTVSNGSSFSPSVRGGGIYASLGTITGNDVANNTANASGEAYGGGIYAAGSTTSGNVVTGNAANASGTHTGFGGGVYTQGGSLQSNIIQNNSATGGEGWGGGVYSEGGNVQGNEIVTNNATRGGGVYGEQGSITANIILTNTTQMTGTVYMAGGTAASNTIEGNTAGYGGGLFGDNATLVGNTLQHNEATIAGGGVYALSGAINGNTVNENETQNHGGGVYAAGGTFSGNIISGNSAPVWGRGSGAYLGGAVQFTYNTVVTNTAGGGAVGGLAVAEQPTTLRYNNLHGNQPYDAEVLSSETITAPHNYWGPATCTDIGLQVYDGDDVPGRGELLYSPSLYAPVTAAQLATPANLSLTQVDTTTVTLTWQPISPIPNVGCRRPGSDEPDLGYRLYYDTNGMCSYDGQGLPGGDSPIDVGQDTTLTLTGLSSGDAVYFSVTAYDYLGRESIFSNQVFFQGSGGMIENFLPLIIRRG